MGKKRRKSRPALLREEQVPFSVPAKFALALILALQAFLGLSFIRSAAPTYDESVHLASGYSYWHTGRYRMNIMDHPPLAEMWAALPLRFMKPGMMTSHRDFKNARLYHFSDAFLFQNTVGGERMMNAARTFLFLTLSALLAWGLLTWAYRLGGPTAAVGAAAAAAFCPVLISNLALAGTDGVSSVFFFLVFRLLSPAERSRRTWVAAGLCAGLALAAKFNMIILLPMAGGLVAADFWLRGRESRAEGKRRPEFPWAGCALAALGAAAALVLVYRVTELPYYFKGLAATIQRLDKGRSAFLLGAYSVTGFWLYFPAALAVKTPLPTLLFASVSLIRRLRNLRRETLWIAGPLLGYFAVALTAKVQIGVRHLLPIMPFLVLLAGCGAARLWEAGGKKRWAAAAGALWLTLSVLNVHPYQLAYFNEAAGGPANGYRWMVDSNLDWGQDLKTLGAELRARGGPPIYLAYFGSADPAAYGIRYVPAGMCCNVTRGGDAVDPAADGKVLFAVSATNLQAVYFADKSLFSWLQSRRPEKVLGHSIFLYDLTEDAEGRRLLARLVALATGDSGRAKSLLLQ
ncbi:MAG: hypothetical protein ABIJ96_14085 [Elusimicrobiota bacterium]